MKTNLDRKNNNQKIRRECQEYHNKWKELLFHPSTLVSGTLQVNWEIRMRWVIVTPTNRIHKRQQGYSSFFSAAFLARRRAFFSWNFCFLLWISSSLKFFYISLTNQMFNKNLHLLFLPPCRSPCFPLYHCWSSHLPLLFSFITLPLHFFSTFGILTVLNNVTPHPNGYSHSRNSHMLMVTRF